MSGGTIFPDLSFWMLGFKPAFSFSSFTCHQEVYFLFTFFHKGGIICISGASQVALAVKNLPANAGDIKDAISITGSGRSPGGEYDSPPRYSCLENPLTDKSGVLLFKGSQSQTWLKWLSTDACICISEVVDISPSSLDFSLWFIQPRILHDVLCIEVK